MTGWASSLRAREPTTRHRSAPAANAPSDAPFQTRRLDAGLSVAWLYIQTYTVAVRFSWDARKSASNLRERGFDFAFATLIFDGPTLEQEDRRRDYGERRVIALGEADGIGLAVVYTDRVDGGGADPLRRIISARVSNRRERQAYRQAIQPTS